MKGFHSKETFEETFDYLFPFAIKDLHSKSTPGECSLKRLGSTNGQILGLEEDGTYDQRRIEIVKSTILYRFKSIFEGKYQPDPIKLFIKCEPHKQAKIESNRFRLISSVSLEDALIDRILLYPIMKKAVSTFQKTLLLFGYSPLKGGHRWFSRHWDASTNKLMVDKTAFDWTVHPYMIEMLKDVLISLNVNASDWWINALNIRFKALFEQPEFIFSDGTRVIQPVPGIMKSGCYITILGNSIIQLYLKLLAHLRSNTPLTPVMVIGDDTIEEDSPETYCQAFYSLGVLPKFKRSFLMEFAGFAYPPPCSFAPEYKNKHSFTLLYLDKDPEIAIPTLISYQYLYMYDKEMLEYIRKIIKKRNIPEAHLSDKQLQLFDSGDY